MTSPSSTHWPNGRPLRSSARWFPHADVVVGVSHMPWHQIDVRDVDGHVQHQVNPGSAMQRRGAPHHTAAVLDVIIGVVAEVTHIVLP